jgi:hypothetical protein
MLLPGRDKYFTRLMRVVADSMSIHLLVFGFKCRDSLHSLPEFSYGLPTLACF